MTSAGYNVRKAAQVTAYFAHVQGGSINVLKLVKLIYLADRAFLARYDLPMLFDNLVSMDHGPVNSRTLNYINGGGQDKEPWSSLISGRANYEVGLTAPVEVDALDELSDAEVEVLEETWAQFGSYYKYDLRDYTHKNCPEWEDPDGSSNPIPYERLLKFLGKEKAREISEQIDNIRYLDQCFEDAGRLQRFQFAAE